MVGPVLSNLNLGGHKAAAKAVAKHIVPYTGLKNHETGDDVHQLLHEGNVTHAIKTLKNNTAKFRPHHMWLDEPMPVRDSIIPYNQMNSYQVYRAARKTLPYIDHILTDRLKSQSIVDSSLTTALFSDLKKTLNKDLTTANTKLQKVLVNTMDSLDEQKTDRITLYSACGIILLVSLSGVLLMVRCLCKVQSKVNKMNKAMCDEGIPLTTRSRHPSRVDWCNKSPTTIELETYN